MDRSAKGQTYEFGGYSLDLPTRQLADTDGRTIDLSSRAFDALTCLVQRPGELVDKATLMGAVWPDTVVEENNLNQAIAAIRKALGDTGNVKRFVATDPGRGYRFVAEVSVRDRATPPADEGGTLESRAERRWLAAGGVTAVLVVILMFASRLHTDGSARPGMSSPEQSIAVLPFDDMSPDGDQEYFSDGVAEEILNHLTKIPGLRVTGRTSSFSFKGSDENLRDIGGKLNVAHLLEGSVRKDGKRLRVTVQLVQVSDGYQVWSRAFDGDLEDIFAIQEETARAVANALSISLGISEDALQAGGTRNFEAYDARLAALSALFKQESEETLRAIELLERAVALDPNFADAWSVLSLAYLSLGTSSLLPEGPEISWERSEVAAQRAMEAAPGSVAALRTMASLLTRQGRWLEAEELLRDASRLSPSDLVTNLVYAYMLEAVGRPAESIPRRIVTVRLEPLALVPALQLGVAYQSNGDTDEAWREMDRARNLIGSVNLLYGSMLVVAMERRDRALIEEYMAMVDESPGIPEFGKTFTRRMRELLDSPAQARTELRRMRGEPRYSDPGSQDVIATYSAYFGDPELTLEILLDSADREQTALNVMWRIWWPLYQDMRRLPGFKDLARKTGLLDYWRETGNWGQFCRPLGDNDFECE